MNVGEMTLDVGETTSYVGELVVGELTRWRNDRSVFDDLMLRTKVQRYIALRDSRGISPQTAPVF